MTAACAIVLDRREDGRYRATCSVFPDYEATRDTPEAAQQAFEELIGRILRERHPDQDPEEAPDTRA
jgi:hypothetical protein